LLLRLANNRHWQAAVTPEYKYAQRLAANRLADLTSTHHFIRKPETANYNFFAAALASPVEPLVGRF
jgi:hypothetical protein